jgi:hypothetical protein
MRCRACGGQMRPDPRDHGKHDFGFGCCVCDAAYLVHSPGGTAPAATLSEALAILEDTKNGHVTGPLSMIDDECDALTEEARDALACPDPEERARRVALIDEAA